eukprot:scaffold34868_cov129-Isochrysis_galbana.AAC.3
MPISAISSPRSRAVGGRWRHPLGSAQGPRARAPPLRLPPAFCFLCGAPGLGPVARARLG